MDTLEAGTSHLRRIEVGNKKEGLCDGSCNWWFHRVCVGVPKAKHTKLVANKWLCNRVDHRPKSSFPSLSDIMSTLKLADGIV